MIFGNRFGTLCAVLFAIVLSMSLVVPVLGAGPDRHSSELTLERIAPKPFLRTLIAIENTMELQKRNKQVRVPSMTLLLSNGSQVNGWVTKVDFDHNRLAFLVSGSRFSTNVAFLDFAQVTAFILNDLHLCPEFLKELEKQPSR